jgi:uncharacterized membrane protein YdbT with pleckstrin-like domain
MSYVDKHLLDDEQIVARVHLHWIVLAGPALVVLVSAFFVGYTIRSPRSPGEIEAWVLSRLIFTISTIALLVRVIRWLTAEYVLTDRRLVVKTGWLRRDLIEVWLPKIEGIQAHQTIVGRLLGYATLMVKGLGGTRELHPNIIAPLVFQQAIRRQLSMSSR